MSFNIIIFVFSVCNLSSTVYCNNTLKWSSVCPDGFDPKIYQDQVEKASGHGASKPIKYGARECNKEELFVAYKQSMQDGQVFAAVFQFEGSIWRLGKDTAHTNKAFENFLKRLFPTFEEMEKFYTIPENRLKQLLQCGANFIVNASTPILTGLAFFSPGAATCLILTRFLTDVIKNVEEYDVANKIKLLKEGKELYDKNKTASDISENIIKNQSQVLNYFGKKIVEQEKVPIGNKVVWVYQVPSDFISEKYQDAVETASGHGTLTVWRYGSRGDIDELFVNYKLALKLDGEYIVAIFRRTTDGYVLETNTDFQIGIKTLYKTMGLVEKAYTIDESWAEELSEKSQILVVPKPQLPAEHVLPFSKVNQGTKCRLLLCDFTKEVTSPTDNNIIMEAKSKQKEVISKKSTEIDYGTILKTILLPRIMPKESVAPTTISNKLVWTDVAPLTFDSKKLQDDDDVPAKHGESTPNKYGMKATNVNELFVAYEQVHSPKEWFVAIFQQKEDKWELVKDLDETQTFEKGYRQMYQDFDSLDAAYGVQDCVVHEMAHRIPTALNGLSVLGKLVETYTNPEMCKRLFFFMQNVNGQHDASNLLEDYRVFKEAEELLQKLTSVVTKIVIMSETMNSVLSTTT